MKLYLGTLISFSTKWVLNSYDVNEICSASPFSGAITEEEIYPYSAIRFEWCFGLQQGKDILEKLSLSAYALVREK